MGYLRDDLRDVARTFPDRVAVKVAGGAAMTFAEWDRRADAVARGLAARGVTHGDRVVLLLENAAAIDFHVGYIAVHRAGATAVAVNPRYAAREIAHVLKDAAPAAVIAAGPQVERAKELGASVVTVAELRDADDSPFDVPIDDGDLADVFYTSGTTGLPKGVASTHANSAATSLRPLEAGGVLLHAIPLASFTGLHGGVVTPLRLALTSVVQPVFETAHFGALIASESAQSVLLVPAQIALLLDSGVLDRNDVSSVRTVMFGGAATPPAVVEALAARLPRAMLLNGYGLTEAGGSVCVLPPGEAARRPGSVGKPLPGVQVRVVDDTGADVVPGEVGEILLHVGVGDRRYYNDDALTATTWDDGWVHTGDLGRVDDEGFLYVVDRTKDMVNRGGYNVYSIEVENALHEHPDVVEAAVVGIPHRVLGQDVCAVIRQRAHATPLDVAALHDFLADRIADYKHPRQVVLHPDPLPRTAMGKLDKKAVLDLVAEPAK